MYVCFDKRLVEGNTKKIYSSPVEPRIVVQNCIDEKRNAPESVAPFSFVFPSVSSSEFFSQNDECAQFLIARTLFFFFFLVHQTVPSVEP